MTNPTPIAAGEPERRPLSPEAARRFAALVRADEVARLRLGAYLEGLAAGLGVAPDAVLGVDDTTGEVLLGEKDESAA